MIDVLAHVTHQEAPAGVLVFVAGMAAGVAAAALAWRLRRTR